MESVTATFGEGKYRIIGTALLCGQDITMAFTGGTLPHVGAVSLAVYEPKRASATVSTICVYTHRDDRLAAEGAKAAATELKCTATVSVGIHIDEATPDELNLLIENFKQCCCMMIAKIKTTRIGVIKNE